MNLRKLRAGLAVGARALRRDWRAGELKLLMLALVVAVAAVTSVGFLADRVSRGLDRNSAQLLGGDLALRADTPISDNLVQDAHARKLETVRVLQFPSMARTGQSSQLVSLKAVEAGYPLRGELRIAQSAQGGADAPAAGVPEAGTAWVDGQLANLLGLKVGEALEVGDLSLKVTHIITYEPDRGMQFINAAPRLMMNLHDIAKTGLLGPGSRVRHMLLLAGDDASVRDFHAWLTPRLERGQRIVNASAERPAIRNALERSHQFLMLVSLLSVMLAAVAIALAARRFALRHQDGIGIMRCLGARKGQITAALWVEFVLLGLAASGLGAVAGFAVHLGLIAAVQEWLNIALPSASFIPAGQGFVAGMLLLLGFALPPLAVLRDVPPTRVLRREAEGMAAKAWPSYAVGFVAALLLIFWISGDLRLTLILAFGCLLAVLLFAFFAFACIAVVAKAPARLNGSPAARFALSGMARRKGLSITQICSLATGLMILLLLTLIRTDLMASWQQALPDDAPNTFLINILPDQRKAVAERLAGAGIDDAVLAPMVRGRLVAIDGVAVDVDDYKEDRARRLVDREFNLSYMEALPSSNTVIAGRWLNPRAAEVSLEQGLAETLGIGLGDMLEFDVAGQRVEVNVTSIREVKWDSFQTNFFAILSPEVLRDAPATYITSFHLPAESAGTVRRLLGDFPNLTFFDVGAILGQLQNILDQVVQAVQLLFLFALGAGVVVLGAAFFATRDERMHEVAVLRVLGATSAMLTAALRIELLMIGAIAGLLAAFMSTGISWALATWLFDFPFSWSWWPWVVGSAGGALAASAVGGIALKGVLDTPPLVTLRQTS